MGAGIRTYTAAGVCVCVRTACRAFVFSQQDVKSRYGVTTHTMMLCLLVAADVSGLTQLALPTFTLSHALCNCSCVRGMRWRSSCPTSAAAAAAVLTVLLHTQHLATCWQQPSSTGGWCASSTSACGVSTAKDLAPPGNSFTSTGRGFVRYSCATMVVRSRLCVWLLLSAFTYISHMHTHSCACITYSIPPLLRAGLPPSWAQRPGVAQDPDHVQRAAAGLYGEGVDITRLRCWRRKLIKHNDSVRPPFYGSVARPCRWVRGCV